MLTRNRLGRSRVLAEQMLLLAAVLILWESSTEVGWGDPFYLSSPSLVGSRLGEWFSTGTARHYIEITLREVVIELVAGIGFGRWRSSDVRRGAGVEARIGARPCAVERYATHRPGALIRIVVWDRSLVEGGHGGIYRCCSWSSSTH